MRGRSPSLLAAALVAATLCGVRSVPALAAPPATPALAPTPAAPAPLAGPYDPRADAAADLKAAGGRAKERGKRVLAVVGGNWCSWCRALDRTSKEDPAVAAALARGFEVVHVNYSRENTNGAVLGRFGATEKTGYPYLVVLSPDLAVLKLQETGSLEQPDKKHPGYDTAALVAFLDAWAPGKP